MRTHYTIDDTDPVCGESRGRARLTRDPAIVSCLRCVVVAPVALARALRARVPDVLASDAAEIVARTEARRVAAQGPQVPLLPPAG